MRILSNHSYQFSNIYFKQKWIARVNLMMDIVKQHLKGITLIRLKTLVKPLFMAAVEEMTIDIQLKEIALKHVLLKVNYNDKKFIHCFSYFFFETISKYHQSKNILFLHFFDIYKKYVISHRSFFTSIAFFDKMEENSLKLWIIWNLFLKQTFHFFCLNSNLLLDIYYI